MSLTLPKDLQTRIASELASIPMVHGKISLTIEANCGPGGTLSSVKFKRFSEDEWRPS